MEDAVVGGGAGNAMGPSAADLADNTGPLEERLVHKNWSVKAKAYDELMAICQKDKPNSKADHYSQYCGQFSKEYLKNSNPGALEKALDLMAVFIDKCHSSIVEQNQNDIIPVLVEKCFGHAKPNIKTKAKECLLLMFEVSEKFDISIDVLNALISHKNIKVLTSGNIALAALVENFGVKKIKIAEYGTNMLKNAQNTNPACKNAAYDYYKAVYKWIGDMLLPQIEEKLKKTQMDDLKKAFEEVKAKNDKSKRLTRSEQVVEKKKQEAAEEEKADAQMEQLLQEEAKEEEIDALEFAPEVDVLSKFQTEWVDETKAIKPWQERVAKIGQITESCKNVKIKPGSVDAIANYLKEEIKGSNINIGMAAMDAGTALAKGLKKNFVNGGKTLIGVYLLKYKEKRPMVLDKLKAFLEAIVHCANFENMAEEIIPCLSNPTPTVQNGTVKFVETLTLVTYQDVLERIAPELMPAIVKLIDAKDGGVRDSTLHCLGILQGRLKDKFSKYLKEGAANKQKTEKIDEAAKEVQPSKYDKPEGWKPPVKKPKPAPKPDPKEDVVMNNESGAGDDELMNFDMGPKKRKPPPNIGKKPPSRKDKKPAEDQEMKNEDAPQISSSSSAQPKPAAAKKAPPSAPIIVDESGEGMTKEEAIEKVTGHFQNTGGFDSVKWQEKQEAFKSLQQQIEEQKPDPEMLEAVSKFVKAKMKDFKESNINLMKEIIATYTCIATHCDAINKRTFHVAMQFMVEKIGDIKMSVQIKECVVLAAEKVSPKYISNQIIKYASTTKAPKNIQESCVVLVTICDDFGVKGIPLKEAIDFGKLAAAHATPAVRQSANKLFCELFKHAGEGIRTFMEDIKESTLKVIDAELAKITQYAKGEHEVKRFWVGEKQKEQATDGKKKKKGGDDDEDDLFGNLPREDISKKLNTKLIEKFAHKDWKIRKEAGEDVMGILKEAKMRIEDNGLNPLLEALKNGMKDSNKVCLKSYIIILGQLAQAVGSSIRQYTKKCFVPMIKHLSYKDGAVRAEVVNSMDKWADVIGAEKIIDKVSQELTVDNPESRKEALKWIEKNKESIADADAQSMIKPFIACLIDKSKDIRDQTEALCCEIMPHTSFNEFMSATKDLKPAVQQTLKPILERVKAKSASGGAAAPSKGPEKKKPVQEEAKTTQPVMNSFEKKALEKKQQESQVKEKPVSAKPKTQRETITSARGSKPTEEIEDEGQMIRATAKKKETRAFNDSRTKYPINEVKGDHIEKLQAQCMEVFGTPFHDQMFAKSQDFQKHIKCVDQISKTIETEYDQLLLVLDIVFKWTNLRMTESSNTQLAVNIFEFYKKLLTKMIENGQQLQEFEMIVLLATLCDKSGLNNKNLQDSVRKLIRMCYQVYDIKGCYRFIVDYGVKNKNLKSGAECLDEIADFIVANGVDVIQKKDYKTFVEMADNRDKSVRENSLKVFGEAYMVLGEKIWTFLKDIPPKVKGLLEERFKAVNKKTGGLGASINSAKGGNLQNTLTFKKGGDKLRQSIAPGSSLGGSLGGFKKKNALNSSNKKPSPMKSEKSGNQDQEITNKLADMDPFGQSMKIEPANNDGDIDMKDETDQHKQKMQDIFKQAPKDEDMPMEDPQSEPQDQMAQDIKNLRPFEQESKNQNQQRNMNEDDDLIQQKIKDAEQSLHADPALREQIQFILSHIQQLREGDLLKRVDSLVLLNEVISATGPQNQAEAPQQPMSTELVNQQKALIFCCNDLINAFTHVMDDIFKHPVNDIPLRFTKYFITIVNKTCTSKEIMTEVSEKSVHDLVEQLLTRLLIENLDKIGQNKEGELILKNLNSSMIRMLENCNHTYVFGVLFGLLKNQNENSPPKMHGLIIKCLLKLNKIMHKLIEKLDMQKFLISIHEYLVIIDHNNRTQNDDLGIRIVKTLINEIVKLKGESIWQPYEVIRQHQSQDNHIEKWILIILKSLQLNTQGTTDPNNNSGGVQGSTRSATMLEFEFKKILMELRDPTKYDNAIQRLAKFAQNYPQYNYTEKLDKEQPVFKEKVLNSLEQYKNGSSWKSTNNTDSLGGQKQEVRRLGTFNDKQGQDLNKSLKQQNAFESKMAKFKRASVGGPTIGGLESNRNTTTGAAGGNLNTSFSAMNQKFVDKWDNMKKKNVGGNTQRPSTASNNLSQTMGPGGFGNTNQLNTSQNKFQSKFASKIQQSRPSGGPGFQTQSSTNLPTTANLGSNQAQQPNQDASGAPRSQRIGGGISNNSFRSRLQGLGQSQGVGAQGAGAQGQSQGAATHQDLKQRLDQMKMKMQALKKQ